MKKGYASLLVLLFSYSAFSNVTLPKIFGDHMVLQRNQPIPVWGWANPHEKISVQLGGQSLNTTAGKDGKWMVKLAPEKEGGPYQLVVKAKNTITINDVLVGEVWVCSGQSNMQMPIAGWGYISNYKQEIADADYPQIRQFLVTNAIGTTPKEDLAGGDWKPCSPVTAGDFTAAGYFFARELYRRLHIPVGLINSSWGGTMIETWISHGALENSEEFKSVALNSSSAQIAKMEKEKAEIMDKEIASLQGPSTVYSDTAEWKNSNFDDSHWPRMKLPGVWEAQKIGLENLDGMVWFRKTIIIDDIDTGKPAVITLGKIDDSDETFVNGVKVGGLSDQYNVDRQYNIPAGVLKPGKNVIAIRVDDTGGNGGIYGDAPGMKLVTGNKELSLDGDWLFKIQKVNLSTGGPNSSPSLLFNAMINPIIPYGIRGAIWYQGEANAGRAYQYRKAFPLLIQDWRQQWGQGNFPFYFVQLASFNAGGGNSEKGSDWAELREAQTMTLSVANTGMAVTTDIGESNDIHPKNKQDVGKRLALAALANTYAQTNEFSGPVYASMKTEDNKIVLSFTHTGSGLLVKDKYGYLKGFEIAGADQKFHWAKGFISGANVVVYAEEVPHPVAVRYAWADDALEANLFNKEGLPAGPFRTDSWKGVTEGLKYVIGE